MNNQENQKEDIIVFPFYVRLLFPRTIQEKEVFFYTNT